MSPALEFSATALNYLSLKGIKVDIVDTNPLKAGGANALLLSGYSNRNIQKSGDGEGEHLRSTYERSYIVFCRAR